MADHYDDDATALAAAARLRAALEQLAGALARLQLDVILEAESALECAMLNLPSVIDLSAPGRGAVRGELERARAALTRSKRLGAALGDLAAISLDAQGHSRGYGRVNGHPGIPLEGRQLDTTV